MPEYDAVIKNWSWHPAYTNSILGEIYEDTKGRFTDGQVITTSTVQKVVGNIIYTKNTVYKLEEQHGT